MVLPVTLTSTSPSSTTLGLGISTNHTGSDKGKQKAKPIPILLTNLDMVLSGPDGRLDFLTSLLAILPIIIAHIRGDGGVAAMSDCLLHEVGSLCCGHNCDWI